METPNETLVLAGIITFSTIWGRLKLLILSSFLTWAPVNTRVHSSCSSRSIMLWVNTVISRGANEITSFHQAAAADHHGLLLQSRVESHSEGLKVVHPVTKRSAVSIYDVSPLGNKVGRSDCNLLEKDQQLLLEANWSFFDLPLVVSAFSDMFRVIVWNVR